MARYKKTIRQGTDGKVMVTTRRGASTAEQAEPVQQPIEESKETDEGGNVGSVLPEEEGDKCGSAEQEKQGIAAEEGAIDERMQEHDRAVARARPADQLDNLPEHVIASDIGEDADDIEAMQERDPQLRQRINDIHLKDPEVQRLRKNNHKNLLSYIKLAIKIAIRQHKARMEALSAEQDGKMAAVSGDNPVEQARVMGQAPYGSGAGADAGDPKGNEAEEGEPEVADRLDGGTSLDEPSDVPPSPRDSDDDFTPPREEEEGSAPDELDGEVDPGGKRKKTRRKKDRARTPSGAKKRVEGDESSSASSDVDIMESNTVTGSVLREIVASPSKKVDDGGVEIDNDVVQNLFQIEDRAGAIGELIPALYSSKQRDIVISIPNKHYVSNLSLYVQVQSK
jgi:hypothetical protein